MNHLPSPEYLKVSEKLRNEEETKLSVPHNVSALAATKMQEKFSQRQSQSQSELARRNREIKSEIVYKLFIELFGRT